MTPKKRKAISWLVWTTGMTEQELNMSIFNKNDNLESYNLNRNR